MYPLYFLPDFGPSSGEDLFQKWCNFCFSILTLSSTVKTLLHSGNNLTALNGFTKVMKMTNHTTMWDAKLAWYSLSATYWICFYGFEHGLRIHSFRPTWLCPIIKVLSTWAKLFEPSGYCIGINFSFIFCLTKVFSCSCSIIAQFKFISYKFLI